MGDKINADDVFEHLESGQYVIIVGTGSMKPEGGTWYDSVSYRNPTGEWPDRIWTRQMSAFREKFKRV